MSIQLMWGRLLPLWEEKYRDLEYLPTQLTLGASYVATRMSALIPPIIHCGWLTPLCLRGTKYPSTLLHRVYCCTRTISAAICWMHKRHTVGNVIYVDSNCPRSTQLLYWGSYLDLCNYNVRCKLDSDKKTQESELFAVAHAQKHCTLESLSSKITWIHIWIKRLT